MNISNQQLDQLSRITAELIVGHFKEYSDVFAQNDKDLPLKAYAVPRGGVSAALAIQRHLPNLTLVDEPIRADLFIDDLIDSGNTKQKFAEQFPNKPFFALLDKAARGIDNFVVWPWERTLTTDHSGDDIVMRFLQYIGEDATREGLQETPQRFLKAWKNQWAAGYSMDAGKILKVFEDGAESYDQMVVVKDIPIYSHCEHHIAPIFGTATIAYIPNGRIVGLSKLSRLADMFARRLQVQERLTQQIANALQEHLNPLGVGVVIKARHMCMESRGVCQQGHHTITTALHGVIKDEAQTRAEFLSYAN